MPNSTQVWPLRRHCQCLARSQPGAAAYVRLSSSFSQEVKLTQTGKNVKFRACDQLYTKKKGETALEQCKEKAQQLWVCKVTSVYDAAAQM